jgi:hypothetical protein
MEPTPDELAGVVDLFGALTRAELREGLAELAYKGGDAYDPEAFAGDVEAAVSSFHLVPVAAAAAGLDTDGEVLVVGPVAFPELPDGAEDLPHILEVDTRTVDRETAADAAARRFRTAAASAVQAGDTDRVQTLLDVSYELEAWGDLALSAVRERLDAAGG